MNNKKPLNYVRTLRRRWALTQKELADLLGFENRACISRIEQDKRIPSLESALALEVLFGVAPRAMFPRVYAETEEEVMQMALHLYEATFHSSSLQQQRKRQALDLALKRATKSSEAKGV